MAGIPFLGELAKTGPLGIVCAILFSACLLLFRALAFMYQENKELNEKRIQDAKEITQTQKEPLNEIKETLKSYGNTMTSMVMLLQNMNGKK